MFAEITFNLEVDQFTGTRERFHLERFFGFVANHDVLGSPLRFFHRHIGVKFLESAESGDVARLHIADIQRNGGRGAWPKGALAQRVAG